MKKKLLLAVLSALMIAALVVTGCGKDTHKISENVYKVATNPNQLKNVSVKVYRFYDGKATQTVDYIDKDQALSVSIRGSEILPTGYLIIKDGKLYEFLFDEEKEAWYLHGSIDVTYDLVIESYLEGWEIGSYSDYIYNEATGAYVSSSVRETKDDPVAHDVGATIFFEKNKLTSFQKNYVFEIDGELEYMTSIYFVTEYEKTKVVIPTDLQTLLDTYFK